MRSWLVLAFSGRTTLERAVCKVHTSALKVFWLLDSTDLAGLRSVRFRPIVARVAALAHSNGARA
jgi:hypothetical protein